MMRMNFRLVATVAFALAMTLSACDSNNDSNDDNVNPGATGKMQAKIDGTQWDAANATANEVTAGGFTVLTIAGATTSTDALTISFLGDVPAGTYTVGEQPLSTISFIRAGDSLNQTYLATSGSVTISTINSSKVVGTFSFEAERLQDNDTIVVTSGSFDVGYGVKIGV
jgi:hypothetical protein